MTVYDALRFKVVIHVKASDAKNAEAFCLMPGCDVMSVEEYVEVDV